MYLCIQALNDLADFFESFNCSAVRVLSVSGVGREEDGKMYTDFGLVKHQQAHSSLGQHSVKHFVENHLR
jgi:hypothetical protein